MVDFPQDPAPKDQAERAYNRAHAKIVRGSDNRDMDYLVRLYDELCVEREFRHIPGPFQFDGETEASDTLHAQVVQAHAQATQQERRYRATLHRLVRETNAPYDPHQLVSMFTELLAERGRRQTRLPFQIDLNSAAAREIHARVLNDYGLDVANRSYTVTPPPEDSARMERQCPTPRDDSPASP